MTRYSRHIILSEIGEKGQEKLKNSKVLVIGAGGLGSPVLQYLAAAGIGNLGIMDGDVVDVSNLQRQVLYGTSSLGKNKAEAAKVRLEDLNSEINIKSYPFRLTKENAISVFNDYDIIVDATDNIPSRYLINDAAVSLNRVFVYAAINKFDGQISVFNYKNGPSYRCLFPDQGANVSKANCESTGVLGVLPGIIGTMQANEVLKIILELGDILSSKLLVYNALSHNSFELRIEADENQKQKIKALNGNLKSIEYSLDCKEKNKSLKFDEISDLSDYNIIDVREIHEYPKLDFDHISIPMSVIHNAGPEVIKNNKQNLVLCSGGEKSKIAIKVLKSKGFKHLVNLEGGLNILIEKGILQY